VVIRDQVLYRLTEEHSLYLLEQNFKRKAAVALTAAFYTAFAIFSII
jgi:hypothetical protein